MKLIQFFGLSVLLAGSMVACKKDAAPPVDLGGTTWSDSANVSGIAYKPFTIVFKKDGTATVTFNGYSAFAGSWNKPPNSDSVYIFFDESYTTKWKAKGVLTSSNTKIEGGVLTRVTPDALTGTFQISKQ